MARIVKILKLLVLVAGATALWNQWSDLSWSDMDLLGNGDGHTDLFELLPPHDFGTRNVVLKGVHCTDYFRLKDGLPFMYKCAGSKVPLESVDLVE